MNLELLNREELTNFVKWTTANLRDDKKLPKTFSLTRTVEAWEGRNTQVEVDLTEAEVFELHVELGFVKPSDEATISL